MRALNGVAVVPLVALAVALTGCGAKDDVAPPADALPSGGGRPPATVGLPSDPNDRASPKGVVMLVRGGGWAGPDPATMRAQRPAARFLQESGFITVSPDYRAGTQGFRDLLARYDQTRKRFPNDRVCLFGQSAGGHLALLVASRRPDVACVVSQAAPTDLTALARDAPGAPTAGWARRAFGADGLRRYSPSAVASTLRMPVLQIAAENDRYVPIAQVRRLESALPAGRLVVLGAGSAPFVHSTVDADQLAKAGETQNAFLERSLASSGGRGTTP
ncbi:S9 family peptidase [Patulibacter sp.]|uniref:alpha/beta hydrolase family protein n=1 Tax=Patulibacter sp. TaxID=1912859 RepID=UPI002720B72B|nr:alpha/beta fold hydrolase [Patulibacter sp.]MDO9407664.1 prolyl oligopeptidase family serine peptidase [Patulibacter sp.]